MKYSSLILVTCLFIIAAGPRLITLDAHWSSDESRWLHRSAVFMNRLQTRNFDQPLVTYHPGIMTMWFAGLRVFFLDGFKRVTFKDLALARWFIGIAISSGLVVAFFLLRRLFGFWIATFAWVFLVIDPFFLAQSRRVHTDALATIFILLTVLLFLLYLVSPRQYSFLIVSGSMFGCACLSKSYSLILLLWFPVCWLMFRRHSEKKLRCFYKSLCPVFLFLNCSLLTVLILCPVFWNLIGIFFIVCLLCITAFLSRGKQYHNNLLYVAGSAFVVCVGYITQTIWVVFDKVTWAITTPHEIEHFFLGKVINDPGWLFYPFAFLIKSTPLIIPLAIFGMMFLWKQQSNCQGKRTNLRHNKGKDHNIIFTFREIIPSTSPHLQIALVLVYLVLIFTICLSLTSKKFSRYLLPTFPMLDSLAGLGLFYLVKQVGKCFKTVFSRQVGQVACIVLVGVLAAAPVFALHPHYNTYFNPCWRVTDIKNIITLGESSGLDIAAKYLNQKPNVHQLEVLVSPSGAEFFQYYFRGTVYRTDKIPTAGPSQFHNVDYEVVYIRDLQIGRVPQTGTLNGELEHQISLNGINHVWIYRIEPKETK